SGGLPLTLTFAGNEVSFEENSQSNSLDITIPASTTESDGKVVPSTTATATVHIGLDADFEDEEIAFTLAADNKVSFPNGWGDIPDSPAGTLKIADSNVRIGFAVSGIVVPERSTGCRFPGGRPCRRPAPAPAVLVETSGELTETVELTLTAGQPEDGDSRNDVTFNIPNPDYNPSGGISSGNSSTIAATEIDVTLTPGRPSRTVQYRVANDVDPEEVEVAVFSLAFKTAPSDANIVVGDGDGNVATDDNVRPHETFDITILPNDNTVTFAQPSSSSIVQPNGTATIGATIHQPIPASIPGSDGFPQVLIAPAATNGAAPEDFTLSVSGGNLTTIAASGSEPEQYLWTLPTGTGSATLTVRSDIPSADNRKAELALDFSVVNSTLGWDVVPDSGSTTATRTLTLGDPNADGTIGFLASSSSVAEGDGNTTLNVPIVASFAPSGAFNLAVNVAAEGTATQGTDFTVPATFSISQSGRINFAVTIIDDDDAEDTGETIVLEIPENGHGIPAGLARDGAAAIHTITIPPNDNTVTIGDPAPASIVEEAGSATIALDITQPIPAGTAAEDRTITVTPTSASLVENTDYSLAVSGGNLSGTTWTLPTGTSAPTLTVTSLSNVASNETLSLEFAAGTLPTGWNIVPDADVETATRSITITDENGDIAPTVMFTEAESTLSEVTGTMDVGITLSEAPAGSLEVTAEITRGSQYIELASETITITSGTTGDFTVNIPASVATIPSEGATATLLLAAPSGWALGTRSTHTINITPATQRVTFAAGTTAEQTVTESTQGFEVNFVAGAAHTDAFDIDASIPTADQDYVSIASTPANTFAASSATGAIAFNIGSVDGDRTVVITLSRNANFPDGWRLVPDRITLRIEDSEDPITPTTPLPEVPTVAFADSAVNLVEGESADTTLGVTYPANSQVPASVVIPVLVTVTNGDNMDYTLQAGGATISDSAADTTANITFNPSTGASLDLTTRVDSDSGWGRVAVAVDESNLPSGYESGRTDPWVATVYESTATPVGFAESALTYSTAAVDVNITATPATSFPKDMVLVVESSDEAENVIAAGPQVPLEMGETQATLAITPLGGTATGDVVLTLTDPNGALPPDWRIGGNNTLTLTRATAPPASGTINLFSAAGGNVVAESGGASLLVEANLPSGAAAFPAEGIALSLKVETDLADRDDTDYDPGPCNVPTKRDLCAENFSVSAILRGDDVPDFEQDLPDSPRFPFPSGFDPTASTDSEKKYTFTLVQVLPTANNPNPGNPSARIVALIPPDIGVEPEEKITVTLAAEGALPPGWNLGTATHVITVPANGERIGFVADLPTEARESFALVNKEGAVESRWTILPFEHVLGKDPDAVRSVEVEVMVTGRDHNGNTISNIYDQVRVTDQVPTSTRLFTLSRTGGPVITRVGIQMKEDPDAELVQELTVTLVPKNLESTVEQGKLTHTLRVLPSDNTVAFAQPSSANIAQQNGTATIDVTIQHPIPASIPGSDGSPQVLIVPAASNGAAPDDFTLLASGTALESVAASGSDPEKYLWTLPKGTDSATLTVRSDIPTADSRKAELALDFSVLNPALGWSVVPDTNSTKATRSITLGDTTADGTIGFLASSSSVAEGDGNRTFNVPVVASSAPSGAFNLVVNVAAEGTATQGTDFTVPATFNISRSGRIDFAVTIIDDDDAEDTSETIVLKIPENGHGISGGLTRDGAAASHTITIPPNDNTVTFTSANSSATEGGADATVVINIDRPFPADATPSVRIDTRNGGSATASDYEITGTDYSNGILTLPVSPGAAATLTVRAVADSDSETGESVTLVLAENTGSFPVGWEIGAAKEHVVALNDEPVPAIGFAKADSRVPEGDTAVLDLEFTDYTIPAGTSINLKFEASGSATLSGNPSNLDADYDGDGEVASPLIVPFGSENNANPSFSIDILANKDNVGERDETVVLTLLGGEDLPDGVTLGANPVHTITIPANDNHVFFSSTSGTVNENDADGTATLMVTLSLAGAPSVPTNGLPLEINITEGNDNGRGGKLVTFNQDGSEKDMLAFTVPPGKNAPEPPVTVYIIDNSVDVDNDSQEVKFTLSQGDNFPTGWGAVTSGADEFTLTVVDDDAAATIGFAEPSSNVTEPVDGRDIDNNPYVEQHAVALDLGGSAVPSDFALNIGVGTASTADAADYTVPSTVELTTTSSGRVTFNVDILPDIIADDGETLVLTIPEEQPNLPNGVNLVASKLTHTITIADTPPPTVGWENTNVFYTPNSQGGGTFQAKLVTTPRVAFPGRFTFNMRPEADTGTILGPNRFQVERFNLEHALTYNVTGSATGTITISGPGGPSLPSQLPDGWTLANHVLTFAPATNVPTVGFASPDSEAREGTAAAVGISFSNYTIPSGGSISLTFNVDEASTANLTGGSSQVDAEYGGNRITGRSLTADFSAGTTSFNIDIIANSISGGEPDETLILTIDESNLSSLGLTLDTARSKHTITIPANGNSVFFASGNNRATVLESAGEAKLPLRIFRAVAPAGGLPVTLTVTDNAGNPVSSDKVSLSADGQSNSVNFDILPEDGNDKEITVLINADGDTNNETVHFTLTEGGGFPSEWGVVNTASNRFTLSITDDVVPSIGFASAETKVFENAGTVEIELAVSGFDASLLGSVNMGM
ncbi:MAG: hypothetical protein OXF05_05060, partial [Hyphomicrobiales bacterium]|nr:hypothetical protein [Hyphomicrobiales bacterium]